MLAEQVRTQMIANENTIMRAKAAERVEEAGTDTPPDRSRPVMDMRTIGSSERRRLASEWPASNGPRGDRQRVEAVDRAVVRS